MTQKETIFSLGWGESLSKGKHLMKIKIQRGKKERVKDRKRRFNEN